MRKGRNEECKQKKKRNEEEKEQINECEKKLKVKRYE